MQLHTAQNTVQCSKRAACIIAHCSDAKDTVVPVTETVTAVPIFRFFVLFFRIILSIDNHWERDSSGEGKEADFKRGTATN
jgi:hypothetical protein